MPRFLFLLSLGLLTLFSACTQQEETKPTELPDDTNQPAYIEVAHRDALTIGHKVWMNEGSAKIENLTVWNAGEDFASLGIGHFIWYPAGKEGPFVETFPALVDFLLEKGVSLPAWLLTTRDCPWRTQAEFKRALSSSEMAQLRDILQQTMAEQVKFMINRLAKALPTMQATLTLPAAQEHVKTQFYRLVNTPNGIYALLDYVNFKGEGVSSNERYNGLGWGLLQVLEHMPLEEQDSLAAFRRAATYVLQRRIRNSPPERNEGRWLAGWQRRINTYR